MTNFQAQEQQDTKMSDIDPNENLLRALGYESIEEINLGAGQVINFDNADPKTKESSIFGWSG